MYIPWNAFCSFQEPSITPTAASEPSAANPPSNKAGSPAPVSAEEMVEGTLAPVAASMEVSGRAEMDDMLNPLNAIRRRGQAAAAADDSATGRIRITLQYNQVRKYE